MTIPLFIEMLGQAPAVIFFGLLTGVVTLYLFRVSTKQDKIKGESALLRRAIDLENEFTRLHCALLECRTTDDLHGLRIKPASVMLRDKWSTLVDDLTTKVDLAILDYMPVREKLIRAFYEDFMTFHGIPERIWR